VTTELTLKQLKRLRGRLYMLLSIFIFITDIETCISHLLLINFWNFLYHHGGPVKFNINANTSSCCGISGFAFPILCWAAIIGELLLKTFSCLMFQHFLLAIPYWLRKPITETQSQRRSFGVQTIHTIRFDPSISNLYAITSLDCKLLYYFICIYNNSYFFLNILSIYICILIVLSNKIGILVYNYIYLIYLKKSMNDFRNFSLCKNNRIIIKKN